MSILKKQKICKGTGKAKGYSGCGKVAYLEWGLCYSCKKDFLLNTEQGQELIIKASKKAKMYSAIEFKKKETIKKAKLKESIKTLSDYKAELQKEINSIVRLIDYGHGCICTGSTNGKANAGHYVSVGSNDTLRFHLENIWLQSEYSNTYKSGDTLKYQQGITMLFGKDYLEYMNSLQSIKPIKLTIPELKEKIVITRKIVKDLKANQIFYDTLDRIKKRKELNKIIDIYK